MIIVVFGTHVHLRGPGRRPTLAPSVLFAVALAAGCVEGQTFETTISPTGSPKHADEGEAPPDGPMTPTRGGENEETHDVVRIPAGCLVMGSTRGDHDEEPPHEACLGDFFIDRVEVSNARYDACVEAGECAAPDRYRRRPELAAPSHPVVGVSWVDADRYCRFVGMRLPTEAEWELAAAGTDGRRYPWGNDRPRCTTAVYAHCEPHSTVPVDSYPAGASPYGVLHMSGNAWEWVADWWAPYYYRRAARENPTGPEHGRMRAIRGGCWNRSAWHLRVADRDSGVVGLRNDHVGFRCACEQRARGAATP